MAPEMVQNKPHDEKIDIWSLGILLYELIHGNAPFQGKTTDEKFSEILNGNFAISNDCSPECKDLIRKLLKLDPAERPSFAEIFSHQWMKNFEAEFKIQIAKYVYDPNKRKRKTGKRPTAIEPTKSTETKRTQDTSPMLKDASPMLKDTSPLLNDTSASTSSLDISVVQFDPVSLRDLGSSPISSSPLFYSEKKILASLNLTTKEASLKGLASSARPNKFTDAEAKLMLDQRSLSSNEPPKKLENQDRRSASSNKRLKALIFEESSMQEKKLFTSELKTEVDRVINTSFSLSHERSDLSPSKVDISFEKLLNLTNALEMKQSMSPKKIENDENNQRLLREMEARIKSTSTGQETLEVASGTSNINPVTNPSFSPKHAGSKSPKQADAAYLKQMEKDINRSKSPNREKTYFEELKPDKQISESSLDKIKDVLDKGIMKREKDLASNQFNKSALEKEMNLDVDESFEEKQSKRTVPRDSLEQLVKKHSSKTSSSKKPVPSSKSRETPLELIDSHEDSQLSKSSDQASLQVSYQDQTLDKANANSPSRPRIISITDIEAPGSNPDHENFDDELKFIVRHQKKEFTFGNKEIIGMKKQPMESIKTLKAKSDNTGVSHSVVEEVERERVTNIEKYIQDHLDDTEELRVLNRLEALSTPNKRAFSKNDSEKNDKNSAAAKLDEGLPLELQQEQNSLQHKAAKGKIPLPMIGLNDSDLSDSDDDQEEKPKVFGFKKGVIQKSVESSPEKARADFSTPKRSLQQVTEAKLSGTKLTEKGKTQIMQKEATTKIDSASKAKTEQPRTSGTLSKSKSDVVSQKEKSSKKQNNQEKEEIIDSKYTMKEVSETEHIEFSNKENAAIENNRVISKSAPLTSKKDIVEVDLTTSMSMNKKDLMSIAPEDSKSSKEDHLTVAQKIGHLNPPRPKKRKLKKHKKGPASEIEKIQEAENEEDHSRSPLKKPTSLNLDRPMSFETSEIHSHHSYLNVNRHSPAPKFDVKDFNEKTKQMSREELLRFYQLEMYKIESSNVEEPEESSELMNELDELIEIEIDTNRSLGAIRNRRRAKQELESSKAKITSDDHRWRKMDPLMGSHKGKYHDFEVHHDEQKKRIRYRIDSEVFEEATQGFIAKE